MKKLPEFYIEVLEAWLSQRDCETAAWSVLAEYNWEMTFLGT